MFGHRNSLYRRAADIAVDGEGVMLDQVEKRKEDHAVEELLAGYVPLLVRCDPDGESHHKHSAADQGYAGEDRSVYYEP